VSKKNRETQNKSGMGDLLERRQVGKGAPVALVVEDDPAGLRMAGAMLAHLGYGIRAAATPDDAMHLLMADAPALLVVDLCLPMMDGITLIRLARGIRDLRGVPVVSASGVYDHRGEVQQLLAREGVYSFLQKPYTLTSLREAVDFAKGAALRQGVPPPCTMTPGGLWDSEDAEDLEERNARESSARRRGAPRALPASPQFTQAAGEAERARRRRSEAQDAARLVTAAPTRTRDSIAKTSPSNTRTPAAGDFSGLKLVTHIEIDSERDTVELLDCESNSIRLFADRFALTEGQPARLEIKFSLPESEAPESRSLRVLGTLSGVQSIDSGWQASLRITAAQPPEHFYKLCSLIDERRSL
jgi:CheY-like chemotaxis protein